MISIIIPTYRRKKYLLDTINYIYKQTVLPDEILVIDASNDEENTLSEDELSNFDEKLRYYKWQEIGNVSKQRNFGIKQSNGELILFLDDDVSFEENLLENFLAALKETNADAISGLVETKKYRRGNKPYKSKGLLHNFGAYNYQPCDIVVESWLICTANFLIKRRVLLDVGGFDEKIKGSYDDIELGFRLQKAGYKVIHHNLPAVFHFQTPSSGARSPELGLEWSLYNRIYFFLKHFYSRKSKLFIALLLLETIRPSRKWLHPNRLYHYTFTLTRAYNLAAKSLKAGPIYIK